MHQEPTFATKLRWNLPWLVRYPLVRVGAFLESTAFEKKRLIIAVANHFEPAWSASGLLDIGAQRRRLDEYAKIAGQIGNDVRDSDGTKFRHTNFYPAEQYDAALLDKMAEMQADGLGETEIHLHHGVDQPDTADGLRSALVEFRDTLATRHKALSRLDGKGDPRYAFVHGNLALANSCGGRFCGVDNEMEILRDTGCYGDFTLPSAPDQSQVAMINRIYECGHRLDEAIPHRSGPRVSADGKQPQLPLIFTGPLVFDWSRGKPRLEDGSLAASSGSSASRVGRWMSANITVAGRSDWVFVKLYCHGFFDHDQSSCIGDEARAMFGEIVEDGEKTGKYSTHFVSAREMFNLASAAIDGYAGQPNDFRNYRLRAIMDE